MIALVKVISVKPADGYRLEVTFSDGTAGVCDLSDFVLGHGPMVAPLRDQAFFSRVFLSFGVPTWPNGCDIDAVALHMEMAAAGALRQVAA